MIKAEYTDDGKRVVIPAVLWETFKDVFEHIEFYELIRERKNDLKKSKPNLLKIGKQRPFKPFKAIRMTGSGPTASESVIQDRN